MAPFPAPITQTRDFLGATARYGVGLGLPRLMLWETTLADGPAGDLNERYVSRWGRPFDAMGWAGYQAVTLLADAAARAGPEEPEAVRTALSSGGEATNTRFGPDHGLAHPLYLVKPNPDAPWGMTVSQRLAAAELLGEAPLGPL